MVDTLMAYNNSRWRASFINSNTGNGNNISKVFMSKLYIWNNDKHLTN